MMALRGLKVWCGGCERVVVVAVPEGHVVDIDTCVCGSDDWRTTDPRHRGWSTVITAADKLFLRSLRITKD